MPFLAETHISIPNKDLLSWMFDDPSYDKDKPIYIDAANTSRTICYRKAFSITRKLAAGFKAAGVKKGDCVCMLAFNDIYYSMAFMGIVASGGVFAGQNPSYTPYELAHGMRTAKVRFMLVEPDTNMLKNAVAAAKDTGLPLSSLFLFDVLGQKLSEETLAAVPEARELRSWDWLLNQGESDWERFDDKKRSEETPAARLFSSGTTGMPKALDMTHMNFVAQHTMVMEYRPRPYDIRRILCNPMFHASQVPRGHTSAIRGGYPTYVMRRFELEPWLRNIEKYNITEINMVPQMVYMILNSPASKKYSLKSIKNAHSGSAPLDREPQVRFKEEFFNKDTPFNQGWGMSETSCVCTMYYYPEYDPTGGVGKMMPNLDAKLIDDDGNDISAYDVRGELCVRGPTIINGYFENPEANARDWDSEGYFKTGDIAYCSSENKYWYVVDRKKELIKVRGFQVAPKELEGVLVGHPKIYDAAVIGVKYARDDTELPRAYVVLTPGSQMTEDEVKEYASKRLARYKHLVGGVRFIDELPRNANKKLLKNKLREMAQKEIGAKL
ncbi:4-coumarate-CoA ligase-like protein [Rhizodiscina lignyota]|uniref:4-coumarate-CoA ligase-like protein n=1 Tax=Rhizodiscina lignyota TaxID=1504668 RepID=A0A9P4M914_9PEZI|nr:4-coumarate-CoA ligase-like protein [Rhizodiscina lignyota]